MPITRKKDKGDPADILECHTSFVQEADGTFIAYHEGDRVRRKDIAHEVKNYEQFFKLDGDRDPIPAYVEPPVDDSPHAQILKPLPDEETVTCTTGLVTAFEGRVVGIQAGERVPKNHALVKQYPDRFEPTTA